MLSIDDQLIESVTARPVGKKWELTAHYADGRSEVILKKGANRGFVQQYGFPPSEDENLANYRRWFYFITTGKTIANEYKEQHIKTIQVTEAA
tara:strand:+ start:465 stop:743 length:279 start_codon:yes stop_codon:yes gene_type:complete